MHLMVKQHFHWDKDNNTSMNIQLIKGQFDAAEAIEMITQLIHVKIRFHENKINNASSEEDIKMRETRIKQLQKDLYELRYAMTSENKFINIESNISLTV